ncbi:FAD-binding oxidoreductase [Spirochaetota bacterium]
MDIINQINSIVGKDNVITDPKGLEPYSKGNISFIPDRSPIMAVKVGSAEELRSILGVARINKVPVTPFSSGKNGHGASIPTIPGITIDMRKFKTIHFIDELTRNAMIDPGVTFEELQKQAKEKGLRVQMPLELPADSSVISSYIEMSPLYSWPRYNRDNILTMETMLASGELIKIGSAGLPIFNEKPYMPFLGPPAFLNKVWYSSQGTLGIVTKATIKLKTDYEHKKVVFIPFNAFAETIPVIKEIKRLNSAVEFFIANSAYLAGMLSEDAKNFESLKASLPAVTAVVVLRGEKERIEYQAEDLKDLSEKLNFKIEDSLKGDKDASQKILDEIDYPMGYERFKKIKGAYNVIPFICTAMQVPMFGFVLGQMAGAFKYNPNDIGQLLLPVEAGSYHFQYSFYSDPKNPQDHMLVKKFFEVFSETLIKMGAFFSRPYGEWSTKLFSKANAYKELIKDFKEVIDPENIMNPGKFDI